MKMCKCERCGKMWGYSPIQNVSFPVVYLWIGVEADLCPECRKDLLKWLNGNEKTGEKFKQGLRPDEDDYCSFAERLEVSKNG